MKKILVPTDFSENAWNALAYAMAFYKDVPVTYILAHIEIPDKRLPFSENLGLNSLEEVFVAHTAIAKLNLLKEKMLKHSFLHERQITTVFLETNFAKGIKKITHQYEIDLIVMGAKGQSSRINKVVGNHTSSVITKIKYPVMIIPEAASFKIPINIAFPTDYDFVYKAKVLNTLSDIINVHQSNLNILRVANSKLPLSSFQQKNRTYLKDFLKDTSASFHRVNQPELVNGIQSFIDSMKIDMIAMVAKNLNFFQKLLFNPRVDRMSYQLQVPFLIIHE